MGACLADEMGLGKTIQVIALLRGVYEERQKTQPEGSGLCLIVCPKSLVYNWAAELNRFGPGLPYSVYYGLGRDLAELDSGSFRIILSTYATIRRDVEEFQSSIFRLQSLICLL
jgi:SNF2 family DNA or RNA helicase